MGTGNIYGLNEVLDTFHERQENKYDNIIGLSGSKGMGKSTCGIKMTHKYQKRQDFKFSLINNIAYTRDQIKTKGNALNRGSGLLLDEGARAFYKRNWNSKEQKKLIVKFWQIRHQRLFMPIGIQDFFTLDKDLQKMMEFWLHVPKRGLCLVFIKDENPLDDDPWHVKENQSRIKRYYKSPKDGREALIDGMRNMINYMGEFRFKALPDPIQIKFDEISEGFKETSDDPVEKENKDRMNLVFLLKALRDQDYTYNEIHKMSRIPKQTLSDMITLEYPKLFGQVEKVEKKPLVVVDNPIDELYIPKELGLKNLEKEKELTI